MSTNPTKSCTNTNCTQINPQELNQFRKNKNGKNGLNAQCKACCKISYDLWRKANPEKRNESNAVWRKANPDQVKVGKARYYKSNTRKVKAKALLWQKNNPGKVNAKGIRRHIKKLEATLPGLTEIQVLEIRAIYIDAARLTKETGIPHHVDHIVPLQGKNVSGLHVPWNLQILTVSENNKKSNKFDLTYENESWRLDP